MHSEDSAQRVALPRPRQVASSGEVRLAVYDLGGDGADALMVHATGFCAGVWTAAALHLQDLRVAALDVRGHGRSSTPVAGMHWRGTADDVLAAVDELGLEHPFGIGHSMGGASLLLAEQARPGTFRGMWLFEPIVFPPLPGEGEPPNPLALGARRRRDRFDSAEDAFANFAAKPPLSELHPAALAAYVEHGFETLEDGSVRIRCEPEVEAQTYEMGMRHDAFAHLGEVRCPVTVLRGREDRPGPATVAPLVADELPAGSLEDHPELGHFGPLEDPAAMAASIRSAVTAAP